MSLSKLESVSAHRCNVCEHYFGLFYTWSEIDTVDDVEQCPVCGSENINHVEDAMITTSSINN